MNYAMKSKMSKTVGAWMAAAALLLTTGSLSYGQAVPTAVAAASPNPYLPSLDGIVHYALTASELVQRGLFGTGSTYESTALSGDVSYQGKSVTLPFSLLFAGGVLLPNQQGQGFTTYQNIAVSQGLVTRTWNLNLSDSFSFLPQSPTTGLSGIPGVGDLGVVPTQGPAYGPAGGILSNSGDEIGNTVTGSVERQLGHVTSASGSASWSKLYFLNSGSNPYGIDTSQIVGQVGLNRSINARSSASLNAVYAVYDFSGPAAILYAPSFQTRGLNLSYQRTLTRSLNVGASVGPQWVSSSNSALIPSTVNVAISANLSYVHRYTNATLSYSRGVNGGSGVLPGALSDSFSAGVGRPYGRDWAVSLTASYIRTSGLEQFATGSTSGPSSAVFETEYGGVQVTRRISNSLSGFASYTLQNQSFNNLYAAGTGSQNAFGGTSQIFGIGITYIPRSTRLGQF